MRHIIKLIAVIALFPVTVMSYAEPAFRQVGTAVVVDGNGAKVGTSLAWHGAGNVTVNVGFTIDGLDYVLALKSVGFNSGGEIQRVLYESTDCSGAGYAEVRHIEVEIDRLTMLSGHVPAIAPDDPVNNPLNETLWTPDTSLPAVVRTIHSGWRADAEDDDGNSIPGLCEPAHGASEVYPLVPVFDLSSQFTPPYSVKLLP